MKAALPSSKHIPVEQINRIHEPKDLDMEQIIWMCWEK